MTDNNQMIFYPVYDYTDPFTTNPSDLQLAVYLLQMKMYEQLVHHLENALNADMEVPAVFLAWMDAITPMIETHPKGNEYKDALFHNVQVIRQTITDAYIDQMTACTASMIQSMVKDQDPESVFNDAINYLGFNEMLASDRELTILMMKIIYMADHIEPGYLSRLVATYVMAFSTLFGSDQEAVVVMKEVVEQLTENAVDVVENRKMTA